jgi:hypothetical protein
VSEYHLDYYRVFNAGDYFERATAFTTGFYINSEKV